uniref:Uncharacterized protein n=1 Tax=Romanomermis culicivorax TaxID=13658 RepID=A0A915HK26_ROMCU
MRSFIAVFILSCFIRSAEQSLAVKKYRPIYVSIIDSRLRGDLIIEVTSNLEKSPPTITQIRNASYVNPKDGMVKICIHPSESIRIQFTTATLSTRSGDWAPRTFLPLPDFDWQTTIDVGDFEESKAFGDKILLVLNCDEIVPNFCHMQITLTTFRRYDSEMRFLPDNWYSYPLEEVGAFLNAFYWKKHRRFPFVTCTE